MEIELSSSKDPLVDPALTDYVTQVGVFLAELPFAKDYGTISAALSATQVTKEVLIRAANRTRHSILEFLGTRPAEWDFIDPEHGTLDRSERCVFPITVYLEEIRSPFNVGAIFRSAEAFGARRVILSPLTASPLHDRTRRTARGALDALPWSSGALSELARYGPVFALETGGVTIHQFRFPSRGTVLVGSEELGLSPEALAQADQSLGRVSIPLTGAKRSLNVAVAFGILMAYWTNALSDCGET